MNGERVSVMSRIQDRVLVRPEPETRVQLSSNQLISARASAESKSGPGVDGTVRATRFQYNKSVQLPNWEACIILSEHFQFRNKAQCRIQEAKTYMPWRGTPDET